MVARSKNSSIMDCEASRPTRRSSTAQSPAAMSTTTVSPNTQRTGVLRKSCFERIAVEDVRDAADILLPTYEALNYRDGFVSIEVNPHLAHDTDRTIAEARRLWSAVDRPNVMIKVPGTPEGAPAITTLISEGINVNVTLLFSLDAYITAANAYLDGVTKFAGSGNGSPARIASVASFFVSRSRHLGR